MLDVHGSVLRGLQHNENGNKIVGLGPTPGDLPDPGMELSLLLLLNWQVGSLLLCHLGSSKVCMASCKVIPFIGKNVLKMGPEKPVLCMERSEPSGSLDSYENSKQTNKKKKKTKEY